MENSPQNIRGYTDIFTAGVDATVLREHIGLNKKHLKKVGPIRHCEPLHCHSPDVATDAACASMSTTTPTTTTATTRDRGDRYGPMEWAQ